MVRPRSRRALRILPAYWVALTVVAFVRHAPRFTDGHSVLAHYLLVHIYDTREISPGRYQITGGPIQQSWTLATEISFYLFLPVWAWWMARRPRPAERQIRVELLGLALLWCGAIGLKVAGLLLDWREDRYGLVNAWLPFRLDEFALGMTLAVGSAWIAHRRIVLPAWVRGTAMTLGCWAVAALIFWITCTQLDMPLSPLFTPRQTFVVRLLYSFTALLLLLPAVLSRHGREGAPGPVRALFENPLVVWLGLVSYGIYIWHEAWQDVYLRWTDEGVFQSRFWQMLVFTVVLSTASAAVSWYLVERPALRYARPRAGDH